MSSDGASGVLLTGVTGFLGAELLARYLESTDRRVYALVRASDERAAAARVERALVLLFGVDHAYGHRVIGVPGDLTRRSLGLGRRRERLAERVDEIVHCGANVSFATGLNAARAVNVQGTRRMLEFAERCDARGGLRRFTYVSTAYVSGEHAGCFSEDELATGQRFRNAYERSKFEAEQLVAQWRARLPITVVRPSIIVGDRESGWTCSFNVLYWPLRAFSRGAFPAVPARADANVDVVSVDCVADAILALNRAGEAEGGTFHLTAGRHSSSVGEVVELASSFFGRPAPRLIEPAFYRRFVHPLALRATRDPRKRQVLRRGELFFPYLATAGSYDDRHARALLHPTGIEPSPLHDYFERLLEFALEADWGRRQLPRSEAVASLRSPHWVRRRRSAPRQLEMAG
jgi:long-chain acyl-CoA synthetase